MAVLGWLDDSRNPTLWIIAIYPLLIFLLGLACHSKMNRLVQNLPLAPDESARTNENECSTAKDTSSAEGDLISPTFADHGTEKIEPSDGSSPAIQVLETQVPSPKDESSGDRSVEQAAEAVSRRNYSEFLKGVLMYSLRLLLAHRVGVLVTGRVQEKHRLADMLIGLLAMSVVTMMLLMSPAFLGNARLLTLRGYRTNEGLNFLNDPSDPWERFFAISLLSLLVPWLRLLFSFYKW